MIEIHGLTKRFGSKVAVDDLSFRVEEGTITGFLGPNGAGKTTTLRALLGLVEPTAGSATVFGRRYRELDDPLRRVGAVLEAASFHPGRRARNHLRVIAAAAGLPDSRADEVLELVGLSGAAGVRTRAYSLGMRQRLSLAGALLGDPDVLVLDEPANGLDPEGIRWLRAFLRARAADGGTILVSSHVLAEVAQTVDQVVIIHRGRLVRQASLAELTAEAGGGATVVRTTEAQRLAELLTATGARATPRGADELVVDAAPERVGEVAAANSVALQGLNVESASLEDVYFRLTSDGEAPR